MIGVSHQRASARRGVGIPLHRQVYVALRDRIGRGDLRSGDALPNEDRLAREFHVSRVTVRTALAALQADGLIDRRQGKGTFVTGAIAVEPLAASMTDLVAHMRDISSQTEPTVVEFGYGPLPLAIQARLDGRHEGEYQHAARIRSRDGHPLLHITTYVPEDIGRTYTREELGVHPLETLLRRAGIGLHSGSQVVTAAAAYPPVAERLGLAVGEPLVVVRRTYLDREGRMVEYLEMLASPSSFELHTSLAPPDVPA